MGKTKLINHCLQTIEKIDDELKKMGYDQHK